MKTKILAFAGTKQSGKSTACNFIHGYQMRCYGIVDDFAVLDDGSLVVDTAIIDEKGQEQQGAATLDIDRSFWIKRRSGIRNRRSKESNSTTFTLGEYAGSYYRYKTLD